MNRALPLFLIGLLVLALGWATFFWEPQNEAQKRQGLELQEAPKGGDFILQSWQGAVNLRDLRGKVVLLNFGYTWCPDVCPTSLGFLAAALAKLDADELAQVQGLFVSIDPERDTLEHLKDYTAHFHPNILGITGEPVRVADVAKRYGVVYRRVAQDSAAGYSFDHSANTYLIDQQGVLRQTLPHGTAPSKILTAIRSLLRGSQ